ncbi:PQQ-binding-like beta-propeller repeat protein [Nonomuraea terrae]|uniref:outer membrane protein assembly factor BamB family protein n=1 Tax=Nonomuraea terrae TaxID=2530383 RepID=UPI0037880036
MTTTSRARRGRLRRLAAGLALAGAAVALPGAAEAAAGGVPVVADWTSAGQNVRNTHYAATETAIGPANVGTLRNRWTFTAKGSVSASPAVVNGVVYAPDWGGNLSAVNAATGRALWTRPVSDYTGVKGDVSRSGPAYWNGLLVLGDGGLQSPTLSGARIFGVDALTGERRWSTVVDDTPAAMITGSPVVSDGVVYVGVSSKSEALPEEPTFRGSVVALDAATGKLLWKTYTVPEGYTGGAVWGSTPAVDQRTGLVYAATGNNYTTPEGVCAEPDETGCEQPSPDNHIDAVIAFDGKTGAIRWATHTLTADTWTGDQQFGPDFDFGSAPNLFTTVIDGKSRDLLGIGQKSGIYWALDPATGEIVWRTVVGPGGLAGGLEWGSATDGSRIYAAVTNSDGIETTITSATGVKTTTKAGFWAALDAATGKILWQTADPQGGLVFSFVSAANGVLYGGTFGPEGDNMYALDGATGTVKWAFPSGGSVVGGPAIVDGSLYWGSGYQTLAMGFPFDGSNDKLYAFSLPQAPPAPRTVYVSQTGTDTGANTSCGTAKFRSIDPAVRAVASGGRVVVCGGTYKEGVAVTKPLSLEVNGNVVIDATGRPNGIEIGAPGVTVAGFTVQNAAGDGILVRGVDNVSVVGNVVLNNRGGIHLMGSSHSKAVNNASRGNAAGIVISDEAGPAADNVVAGNSVQDNPLGDGILLAGRGKAGVYGTTVETNTVTGNGGGGVTLTSSAAGGAVHGNIVRGNILSGNAGAGVSVRSLAAGQDFTGNVIGGANTIGTNNTKGDRTTGVLVTSADPLTIKVSGNAFGNDHFGIRTDGPVTVADASANTFSGVEVPLSAN